MEKKAKNIIEQIKTNLIEEYKDIKVSYKGQSNADNDAVIIPQEIVDYSIENLVNYQENLQDQIEQYIESRIKHRESEKNK